MQEMAQLREEKANLIKEMSTVCCNYENLYVFLNLILQVTESAPECTSTTTARLQEAQRQAEINRTRAEVAEAEVKELKTQWIIRPHEIELTPRYLGEADGGL